MPNWCMNFVEFVGEPASVEQIKDLFDVLAKKESEERCGQQPDFVTDPQNYFFEIRWDDGYLYYETKWAPNIQDVKLIADHFQVGFIYQYEESGMEIYGEAVYLNGTLTEVDLDQDDFALIEEKEGYDGYLFNGEFFDSQQDILELLLQRKKANVAGA